MAARPRMHAVMIERHSEPADQSRLRGATTMSNASWQGTSGPAAPGSRPACQVGPSSSSPCRGRQWARSPVASVVTNSSEVIIGLRRRTGRMGGQGLPPFRGLPAATGSAGGCSPYAGFIGPTTCAPPSSNSGHGVPPARQPARQSGARAATASRATSEITSPPPVGQKRIAETSRGPVGR